MMTTDSKMGRDAQERGHLSVPLLRGLIAANDRYLNALSVVDDPTHAKRDSFRVTTDETWRAEGEVEEPAIAGRRPGEAGDASRRKVIVEAVSHRVGVRRCGRRTNRGVITCRVMRVHFGVTMAEMHHEHSDTPGGCGVELPQGAANLPAARKRQTGCEYHCACTRNHIAHIDLP